MAYHSALEPNTKLDSTGVDPFAAIKHRYRTLDTPFDKLEGGISRRLSARAAQTDTKVNRLTQRRVG